MISYLGHKLCLEATTNTMFGDYVVLEIKSRAPAVAVCTLDLRAMTSPGIWSTPSGVQGAL